MKMPYSFLLLLILAGCQDANTPAQTYTQQAGIVRISVATRGSYQFIVQPEVNEAAKNYLVTNFTDTLKNYFLSNATYRTELAVIFSGTVSPQKQPVYKPAPGDGPVPDYELPTIQLATIRRK